MISRSTGKEIQKCDLIITDGTSPICATIWEDQGQSYSFQDVKVGFFNRKYLQCTTLPTIELCEKLEMKITPDMEAQANPKTLKYMNLLVES